MFNQAFMPGATVVGISYNDGVILASEKRVSYGHFIVSHQGKKVFQIHLSISIVLILLTLSTLNLFAAFYLGMIAGKSMQRPPEVTFVEEEFPIDNSVSNEDLRFFGLGERKKSQDFLDLEGIKELKNKTEELSKIKDFKQKTPSKILKKHGTLVSKLFMGEDFLEVKRLAETKFKKVQFFNPESSRNESKETYIHCSTLNTL